MDPLSGIREIFFSTMNLEEDKHEWQKLRKERINSYNREIVIVLCSYIKKALFKLSECIEFDNCKSLFSSHIPNLLLLMNKIFKTMLEKNITNQYKFRQYLGGYELFSEFDTLMIVCSLYGPFEFKLINTIALENGYSSKDFYKLQPITITNVISYLNIISNKNKFKFDVDEIIKKYKIVPIVFNPSTSGYCCSHRVKDKLQTYSNYIETAETTKQIKLNPKFEQCEDIVNKLLAFTFHYDKLYEE